VSNTDTLIAEGVIRRVTVDMDARVENGQVFFCMGTKRSNWVYTPNLADVLALRDALDVEIRRFQELAEGLAKG
jgi:hypothetical protein